MADPLSQAAIDGSLRSVLEEVLRKELKPLQRLLEVNESEKQIASGLKQSADGGHDVGSCPLHSRVSELEAENNGLRTQLAHLEAGRDTKIQELHRMIRKSRRMDGSPSDDELKKRFSKMKNDIFHVVKHHFSHKVHPFGPDASSNIHELVSQSVLATQLYKTFFDPRKFIYGLNSGTENVLGAIEETISSQSIPGIEGEDVMEWRARTVQIALAINSEGKNLRVERDTTRIAEHMARYSHNTSPRDTKQASRDLAMICSEANELALLLRSSRTEIRWEQVPPTPAAEVSPSEIVGTAGPNPDHDKYVRDWVVFGAVIRGDINTGLFKDGKTRLLSPEVTIC